MSKFLIVSVLIAAVMNQSVSQVNEDCFGNYPDDLSKISDSELGKAFRTLKNLNNSDCNKFNSDLSRIMNELGDRLGDQNVSIKQLKAVMGKPDSHTDEQHVVKLNEGEELWIYHWRGWHDWLYFVIQSKKVKRADWWFAFE